LDNFWNRISSADVDERNGLRKRWTQDILRLMVLVLAVAALVLTLCTIAGFFTLQQVLPVYPLLLFLAAGWWLATGSAWRWASFVPVISCFVVGAFDTYISGLHSNFALFYAASAVLAGFLQGSRLKWSVVGLSVLISVLFEIRIEGAFKLEMLTPLIALVVGLLGIGLLEGLIDARLLRLLAEQSINSRRLEEEIARRRQAEITLGEQEAQLRRLADNTTDFIEEIDTEGIIIFASPSHRSGLGYAPEEINGFNAFDLLHPDDQAMCRAAARLALENHQPSRIQARCRHADGHYIHIEISGVPLFDKNDRATGFVLVSRDITAQYIAETALARSEDRFSKTFESSPDSININRLSDGVYLDINPGFTKLTGYTREDSIGKSSLELNIWYNPVDRERLVRGLSETGEVDNMEATFQRKNGTLGIGLMSARILVIEGEKCILSITREITERKAAETALRQANAELEDAYQATLQGWVRALELHEHDTAAHSRRVVELTLQIARSMGIQNEELLDLQRGALLHDIGKLGISEEILLKPAALDAEEWQAMHLHPEFAYYFLKDIQYLHRAVDIPYNHHEHWDGSGYPRGLREEQIPLAARIFTVVDVYDALTSARPYRPAWSAQQARDFLVSQKSRIFDPTVVDLFIQIIDKTG
jgi:PAS domain S-box-containing protein